MLALIAHDIARTKREPFREKVKKQGDFSQIWVGGVADSQTRPKPLKSTPKIAFFDPNFTFRFLKSHKNPGVGG